MTTNDDCGVEHTKEEMDRMALGIVEITNKAIKETMSILAGAIEHGDWPLAAMAAADLSRAQDLLFEVCSTQATISHLADGGSTMEFMQKSLAAKVTFEEEFNIRMQGDWEKALALFQDVHPTQ